MIHATTTKTNKKSHSDPDSSRVSDEISSWNDNSRHVTGPKEEDKDSLDHLFSNVESSETL